MPSRAWLAVFEATLRRFKGFDVKSDQWLYFLSENVM
jgi:hypothetical protein